MKKLNYRLLIFVVLLLLILTACSPKSIEEKPSLSSEEILQTENYQNLVKSIQDNKFDISKGYLEKGNFPLNKDEEVKFIKEFLTYYEEFIILQSKEIDEKLLNDADDLYRHIISYNGDISSKVDELKGAMIKKYSPYLVEKLKESINQQNYNKSTLILYSRILIDSGVNEVVLEQYVRGLRAIKSKSYVDVIKFWDKIPESYNGILADQIKNDRIAFQKTTEYAKGIESIKQSEELKVILKDYVEPRIGMNEEEVKKSTWGKPKSINSTVTSSGTHEQWVYNNRYIYFENGKVTAIQESK